MSMTDLDVQESELRLIPGLDVEVADTLRALKAAAMDERPRLVDTTMLLCAALRRGEALYPVQEGVDRGQPAGGQPLADRARRAA